MLHLGSAFGQTRLFIFLRDLRTSSHKEIDSNTISSKNIALAQYLVVEYPNSPLAKIITLYGCQVLPYEF